MRFLSRPRRVVVTGSSRGIGRATAVALAARGHHVVLAARDRAALAATAADIVREGGRADVVRMDVTDPTSVREGVDEIAAGGAVDALVNNAGSCTQARFVDVAYERLHDEMELNYWGAVRVTRALLPAMMARGEGVVVNVSSLLGSIASPTTAGYGATKAALESWTFALRRELGATGVRATVFVAPHTDTGADGTSFEGVRSLPLAYTVGELLVALDRSPRRYAASPVYRALLRFAGFFPEWIEGKVAASAPRVDAAPPLALDVRGDDLGPPVTERSTASSST